jgi:hypothetical protein
LDDCCERECRRPSFKKMNALLSGARNAWRSIGKLDGHHNAQLVSHLFVNLIFTINHQPLVKDAVEILCTRRSIRETTPYTN